MSDYQVIARRFRPKHFCEVAGQAPIVTTIKHALKFDKVAQAYLFCGTRGTGKTTLARLFAMALNCPHLSEDFEPCATCPSCKEIARGEALDVLEIDGASHRGIEDIRQINDSIRFSPSRGKFKIYLIDEVHMLTKEAFNALLKTLEEPPSFVKFLFATTEVEKIPATILSRCQKFQLRRIKQEEICQQIEKICSQLEVSFELEGAELIAQRAEGSLRDALSLLDQILSYDTAHLTEKTVRTLLGLSSKELFERIDHAVIESNYGALFEVVETVFQSGQSAHYFLQELIIHYRNYLRESSPLFSATRLITMLEKLMEAQSTLKASFSERVCLEMTLMQLVHAAHRLSHKELIDKLHQLEEKTRHLKEAAPSPQVTPPPAPPKEIQTQVPLPKKAVKPAVEKQPKSIQEGKEIPQSKMDTLMFFAAKELNASLKKGS